MESFTSEKTCTHNNWSELETVNGYKYSSCNSCPLIMKGSLIKNEKRIASYQNDKVLKY